MERANGNSAAEFELREVTPADGEALQRLFESNPDGGDLEFVPRFKADPYQLYTKLRPGDDRTGFVAETPAGEIVGAGFISLADARTGGKLRPRGYFTGLTVDQEYRGQGLGKRITDEHIQYADAVAGDDVVITAAIQTGNTASAAAARSWADGFPYEYVSHSVETRDEPPTTEYEFRTVDQSSLSAFVSSMNEFYSEAELFVPYRTDQLADLMAESVNGNTVHRSDVLVDDGEFIAGAHVIETYKIVSMVVEELPSNLEAADELPPSIPDDRELRSAFVIPWFKDGHEAAGEALLDYERAMAGDANRLLVPFDPDGPLGRLDSLDPDEGSIRVDWAIRGLDEPVKRTFVAPGL